MNYNGQPPTTTPRMDRIQSSSSIDLGAPGGALVPSRAREAEEPRRSLGGPAGPWAARRSALAARVLILDGGTATEIARRRLRPARRTLGLDPPPGGGSPRGRTPGIMGRGLSRDARWGSCGNIWVSMRFPAVGLNPLPPPSCGRLPSAAVLPRGRVPGLSRRRGPLSGGDHQPPSWGSPRCGYFMPKEDSTYCFASSFRNIL